MKKYNILHTHMKKTWKWVKQWKEMHSANEFWTDWPLNKLALPCRPNMSVWELLLQHLPWRREMTSKQKLGIALPVSRHGAGSRWEGEPHAGTAHPQALPQHLRRGERRQADPGSQGAGAAHRPDPGVLQRWVSGGRQREGWRLGDALEKRQARFVPSWKVTGGIS